MTKQEDGLIEERFPVGGMFCENCERTIRRALMALPGVAGVEADYSSGVCRVRYHPDRVAPEEFSRTLEALGYELQPDGQSEFSRTASLLVIILAAFVLLQRTGLLNRLAPDRLAESGMGFGALFLTGLLTSFHCVAMCGGINLSQSIPRPAEAGKGGFLSAYAPTALYNLGRVVSYTSIGAALGGVGWLAGGGSGVGIPTLLQGVLKLAAGLLMVVMEVNMLGVFPGLRRLRVTLPRGLTARVSGARRGRRPFTVGLLNGIMPCGPLQSMQLLALASGSPLAGGLSMLAFSLGTTPLMLGLGALVSALGQRFSHGVATVGAALVTVLGLAMFSQGGSLSGLVTPEWTMLLAAALCLVGIVLRLPVEKRRRRIAAAFLSLALIAGGVFGVGRVHGGSRVARSELRDGIQVVYSTLESGGYPSIRVRKDIPVRWVITAPEGSVNGCNYRMILREFGMTYEFSEGENVLEFLPTEAGTVAYSCWMGMLHGNIYVE